MRYSQIAQQVDCATLGNNVAEQTICYGNVIHETVDSKVFINRHLTEFSSLEEAREYIKQQTIREQLEQEIHEEQYAQISTEKIASIIQQYNGNIKITDTLIESYVDLASSKTFTIDKVTQSIRQLNKLDCVVEGRLDYVLDDGTTVVITEDTQRKINNIFENHDDVIAYMKSSKENFLTVLNQIED